MSVCKSNFNFESILVMTWRIQFYGSSVREIVWEDPIVGITQSSKAIINSRLTSEDGSVIFNCIWTSASYEWYEICGYLLEIG